MKRPNQKQTEALSMKKTFLLVIITACLTQLPPLAQTHTPCYIFRYVPCESPKMSHEQVEEPSLSGLCNNDRPWHHDYFLNNNLVVPNCDYIIVHRLIPTAQNCARMLPGVGAAFSASAAFSALAACAMHVTASVLASGTKIATDDKEQ